MFLLITVVVSMLLSGCGDDKKKDPTGPGLNPDDYHYYFGISSLYDDRDEEYLVGVSSYDGTEITSVEVTVAGQTYILEPTFGGFIGSITLPSIGAYNYEILIDGNKDYSFNLSPAPKINAQWPDDISAGVGFDVNWNLTPNQDPQVQEISAYSYNEMGEEHEEFEELSPSARSFSVPGSWFSSDMNSFDLDLIVVNYETDGDIIGVSVESSYAEYYSFGKSEKTKLDLIKKAAETVAK